MVRYTWYRKSNYENLKIAYRNPILVGLTVYYLRVDLVPIANGTTLLIIKLAGIDIPAPVWGCFISPKTVFEYMLPLHCVVLRLV